MTAPLTVETIAEGMTIKKTTGFVLHARMSISLGGRSATVVVKARMGTSKPTNPPSETTTAQATVETDLNRNVTDATIGSAHPVATTTSHSVQNATNVESRKQEEAKKDGLVGAFQIVVNVITEILVDVEVATEAVDSVEVVEEIQTDVVEGATEVVVLVATETAVMTDVTLDVVVQAVIATMSAQMSDIEKPEGNGQGMRTTEDLNPFVLGAIKEEIKTTEVNVRDSRSPLLGCA
ncbi:MAG: hypothetical protein VXW72_06820 [Candidatus Thermoplasmatota archaeon]|nr:hypothetical protein [Candidatus Thermoplasmatota archaeon]